MQRNIVTEIVQRLTVVFVFFVSAGIANAQTKVACVGDSITALPSSWCGTLSTKLGSGYTVMNFGVSGTNLAKNVAQPYWNSAQYMPSHTFAPNIVIIMLGTNDSFDNSWPSAKSHFVADYKELLDTYTSLASKPKPYMIIPTPIGTSPFGHNGKLLETEVIPLIKQVAMEKMVPTIDGFTLFGGAMFDASLYGGSDQVHPNAQGQQKLGEAVYKVLMETGALGGASAGAGGSAGSGSTARAGSGGMVASAGTGAAAGSSANTGAAAGGNANAGAAGSGSTNTAAAGSGVPTTSTTQVTPPSTTPNIPARTGLAGASGNAVAGNSASVTSSVAAAGTNAPVSSEPEPDPGSAGCSCRTSGNRSSKSGMTSALLLLGSAVFVARRSRHRRSRC